MKKNALITGGIYYVGANDRRTTLFEGLWPLPMGVTYNSYLIVDEKIALVDTIEISCFERYLANIKSIIGDRQIDYLVINHMEPDHSGAIGLIKREYPNIQIVGNKKTFNMVQGFYGVSEYLYEVKNGEEIKLGTHTLQFYMTPMVHWPETMMTYEVSTSTLFSGDAFGCYGALNGAIVDSDMDVASYWMEMVRYYSNIVGKFGGPVQKALMKLADLDLKYICSTHGPVWHDKIAEVVNMYDRLSKGESDEGVVLVYASMYGNTAEMAEEIAAELSAQGVQHIRVYDASTTDASYILRDMYLYNGVIIGSPTYNGELFPPIESLISKINMRDFKQRKLGYFGSFTWAGCAVKRLSSFAEACDMDIVYEGVEMKQSLNNDSTEQARALARAMAQAVKK